MNKIIANVKEKFREKKGKAKVYMSEDMPYVDTISEIVKSCIQKNKYITWSIYAKDTSDFDKIREDIVKKRISNGKGEVRTDTKVTDTDLIIILNSDNENFIDKCCNKSKFTLNVVTKPYGNNITNKLSPIYLGITPHKIKNAHVYKPVEGNSVEVTMSDEDTKKYNEYCSFIKETIDIFGDFDNIKKCREGIPEENVSPIEYRDRLAKENGWREDLDTRIPYLKAMDDVYNPNNLLEKSSIAYDIFKGRKELMISNKAKFKAILDIVNNNKDKSILIFSQKGSFALDLADYLSTNGNPCGNFNNEVPKREAYDKFGNPILVKSGVNKGKVKMLGALAASKQDLGMFNDKTYKVLSAKSKADKSLECEPDLIILSSPFIGNLHNILNRFLRVVVRDNAPYYVLFCKDTKEQDSIDNMLL